MATFELSDHGRAELALVCWRLSSEPSQVEDADSLIVRAGSNIVGIVLAPINCVDVVAVSLEGSAHRL